jgi:parallel beta-helix repeat protein
MYVWLFPAMFFVSFFFSPEYTFAQVVAPESTQYTTANYYVDSSVGNDANNGSLSTPWASLTPALALTTESVVHVRAGDYGSLNITSVPSRTEYVTIRNYPGETPVLDGIGINFVTQQPAYLRFVGFDIKPSTFYSGGLISLDDVTDVEVLNSNLEPVKYAQASGIPGTPDTIDGVYATNVARVTLQKNTVSNVSVGMTFASSTDCVIADNYIGVQSSSGIKYFSYNSNFLIERNHIVGIPYTPYPTDPDAPDVAHSHQSMISIRSGDLTIRNNIMHGLGSSSGMMFYTPDAGNTISEYSNITIEGNYIYDAANPYMLRMYLAGTNVFIRNNLFVGYYRLNAGCVADGVTNDARYRYETALAVHSLADGYDGSGIHVDNNIFVGGVYMPTTVSEHNNIVWSYSNDGSSFLAATPSGTGVVATASYLGCGNAPTYFETGFFDASPNFQPQHGTIQNLRPLVTSGAYNAGDANYQSAYALGGLDENGWFVIDGGDRASDHSVGPFDLTPPSISSVTATVTSDTTTTITWTTNEFSDSLVEYGPTDSYGASSSNTSLVTPHSLSLSGLTPSTTYHFRVISGDVSSNTTISSDYAFTTDAAPATCASITQYGITWTFDHAYTCGQYVNGDYWVVGPVTITSITPDSTGGRNGWEINPNSHATQPYDSRSYNYNTSALPSLPNTVPINSSVVKTVSTIASGHTNIQTAAVLTVLPSVPANNGTTLFRPPYFGTSKTSYSLSDMDLSGLPSLSSVANTPTLASVVSNFQKVQLDHLEGWVGRTIHPVDNMPDYGSDISNNISDGILRLMLDESVQDKQQAGIMLTQAAIDWYQMRATGQVWAANGGHSMGRKLIILFGGIILNNQNMKDAVSNGVDVTYHENGQVTFYQQANNGNGMVVWGQPGSEVEYWRELATPDSGSKTVLDPYGYIDGGYEPGGVYQDLTAPVFKNESIAARLLPGGSAIWNDLEFFDYVERWVTIGAWTQPDPCAPFDGVFEVGNSDYRTNWDTNYGSAFGTNGAGGCIFDTDPTGGIGRLASWHGNRGNGYYSSAFGDSMYAAYSATADVSSPILMSISSGTAGQTTATITWSTNEGATSRVEYGPTDAYGSFTTIDSNLVTSHSVALVGLTSNTTYHYRILSSDASSNAAVSIDQTFTTAVADAAPSVVTTSTVTTSTSSSSNKSKKKKKKISSKITYKQGERTKPYITLITPKSGSLTNKKFSIKASASDKSGIQAMFVSINGTKKKRVNNTNSILYTAKKLKNASITISAYDKLGNVKVASITVTGGVITGVRYY